MEGNVFQLLSPSPQPASHLWVLVKDCSVADDDDILIRRWDWQGGWSEWWTFPNFSARPPPSQSTASKRHFLFLSLPSFARFVFVCFSLLDHCRCADKGLAWVRYSDHKKSYICEMCLFIWKSHFNRLPESLLGTNTNICPKLFK